MCVEGKCGGHSFGWEAGRSHLEGLILRLRRGVIMKLVLTEIRWDGVENMCWAERADRWWAVFLSALTMSFADIVQGRREVAVLLCNVKTERLDAPVLTILTDLLCYRGVS
jgi:hypothetical protein